MSDYGLLSRVLHRLALGSPAIAEASFDVEQALAGKQPMPDHGGRHVFVAGLARSGTTVLMRSLFETGEFCSLTYRDMPFVLAPGLWSRISKGSRKQREATQRAHGDGVMVDFDSPEALEEVFWRVFCGPAYIRRDCLAAMHASPATVEKFRRYVASILNRYGCARYLSKNNNNILRLGSIVEAFPAARIIVPFRDPLQQAHSLLNQHRRFCEQQRDDKFTRQYMTWLAHHEFGSDHRPFEWGNALVQAPVPTTLNYWLAQWIGVYDQLLREVPKYPGQVRFLSYESLCSDTQRQWHRLCEFIELQAPTPTQLKATGSALTATANADLCARAQRTHEELLGFSQVPSRISA